MNSGDFISARRNKWKTIVCVLLYLTVFTLFSAPARADDFRKTADSLKHELTLELPDSQRVKILGKLALLLLREDPPQVIKYGHEALAIISRTGDLRKKAAITNTMAGAYYMTSDTKHALIYYLQAYRITFKTGDLELRARILDNLGLCYLHLKQYSMASRYFEEALTLRGPENKGGGTIYNNLGISAKEQRLYRKSIGYFKKALELEPVNLAGVNLNIGDAYMELGDMVKARYYFEKAMQKPDKDIYYEMSCYLEMGTMFLKQKKYSAAADYLFRAQALAEHPGVNISDQEVYEKIARMYREQGKYEEAYSFTLKMIAAKDTAFNEKLSEQLSEMHARYESDKKDREILLLNQKRQIADAQIEKEQLSRSFMIGAFVCLIVTGLMIFRNIILRQRVKNKALNEKNMQVEKINLKLLHENSEARYEVLKSKTNPHFLFNSLNTLTAIVHDDANAAVTYIEHFSELYRSILETGDKVLISLKEEIELVKHYIYLQQIRFEENLIINLELPKGLENYSLPPFVVQMVVENAIKHNIITSQRPLHITIRKKQDCLEIVNNLQKRHTRIVSIGIGQKSIMERYALLTSDKPEFSGTENEYVVKIPLLKERYGMEQSHVKTEAAI